MRSVSFEPYREAIAAILRKKSVCNLDEIRKECNYNAQMSLVSYLETVPHGPERDGVLDKLLDDYELITNAAQFENRILLGEDVKEVYSMFNVEGAPGMVTARKLNKRCLAELVEST